MLYVYYAILGAVFFATLAMLIDKGLWSNALSAMNVLLSGLVAFGFYMPLATLASDNGMASFTHVLDFLCLWVLYVVAFIFLHRIASALLSPTQMRFKYPIDTIGGPVMAAVTGWLMTGIVAATLHAAPFDKDCFGGVFADLNRSSTLTNPDLAWLSIAEKMLSNDHLGSGRSKFSPGAYITDFNNQRAALEKEESLKVQR